MDFDKMKKRNAYIDQFRKADLFKVWNKARYFEPPIPLLLEIDTEIVVFFYLS